MTPTSQGYLIGYMQKSAFWNQLLGAGKTVAGGAVEGTAAVADKLFPLLLAAPPLVGVLAGGLHSKATSPSELDTETMQRAIELAELQEMETEMKRKAEVDKQSKPRGVTNERSLRI